MEIEEKDLIELENKLLEINAASYALVSRLQQLRNDRVAHIPIKCPECNKDMSSKENDKSNNMKSSVYECGDCNSIIIMNVKGKVEDCQKIIFDGKDFEDVTEFICPNCDSRQISEDHFVEDSLTAIAFKCLVCGYEWRN